MEDLKRLVQALNCWRFAQDVTAATPRCSIFIDKESAAAGLGMVAALHDLEKTNSQEIRNRLSRKCGDSVSIVTKATVLMAGAKQVLLSTFEDSKTSAMSFLSCCLLCRRELQGLDIFMYRGDMAFCSTECRTMQMANEYQS